MCRIVHISAFDKVPPVSGLPLDALPSRDQLYDHDIVMGMLRPGLGSGPFPERSAVTCATNNRTTQPVRQGRGDHQQVLALPVDRSKKIGEIAPVLPKMRHNS